ncbi:sce7726 family protein [Pseudomonas sp. NyZ480]|uniref:sce7726 family protein n=1 Tax=Pseudomonas sp. NyZ480 TaxID=3035289 RepID=UPI002409CCBB|nr:sce7726 family protein [Pseudomonas sp. NyZ480]WEZ88309.1 sce7726 family protein [Pseudomonas sp. NyZ480]
MSPNASQLSALSRLFSPGVFREISRKGQSALFSRLFSQTGIDLVSHHTVADGFDAAFAILRRSGCRDEYVYRAALTQNVLLGTHSLNSASMLTEFRAGACKADLAILNGTATVYEIKSERDSLARLENQIKNYRKVFAKIYVIAGEAHVNSVLDNTPSDIGVMCLNRRNQISKVRTAVDMSENVCSVTIFESLRSDEARSILNDLGLVVPDVPNTILRSAMRDLYAQLAPAEVHKAMVSTLKRTRSLAPLSAFIQQLPLSLRPIALSVQLRSKDQQQRFINAVNLPLAQAMDWK